MSFSLTKRSSFDSPTNHGPVVAVMTWFLAVASVLWVLTRVGTKLAIKRKMVLGDYLIFLALVRRTLLVFLLPYRAGAALITFLRVGFQHRPMRCRVSTNIQRTWPAH